MISKSFYSSVGKSENTTSSVSLKEVEINYKEELTSYFYYCMLNCIVKKWSDYDCLDDNSLSSSSQTKILTSKLPYTETANHEDDEEFDDIFAMTSRYSFADRKKRGMTVKHRRVSKISSKIGKKRRARLSDSKQMKQQKSNESGTEYELGKDWKLKYERENVTINFFNGNIYEGSVFRKKLDGKGTFFFSDGSQFTGDFKNNTITGYGRLNIQDQCYYEGQFYKNIRHGRGTISLAEKSTLYRGDFFASKKHGKGWQMFRENDWYEGDFENDTMNGIGFRQYASGSRYYGEWVNGQRQGEGETTLYNNDYYFGEWFEGRINGEGKYFWNSFFNTSFCCPVQSNYTGSFLNNTLDGYGILNFGFESGAKYIGYFQENEKHGNGIIICGNGMIIESEPLFINDKPVHVDNTGEIRLSTCGDYYEKEEEEEEKIEEEYTDVQTAQFSSKNLDVILEESIHDSIIKGLLMNSSSSVNILKTIRDKIRTSMDGERHYNVLSDPNIVDVKKQIIRISNYNLTKEHFAYYNICKKVFPKFKQKYLSIEVPLHIPTEMINLHHILRKMINKYYGVNFDESDLLFQTNNSYETYKGWNKQTTKTKFFDVFHREENNLRAVILIYLPVLKEIYGQYSKISCSKKPKFKTWMLRIFLWQFCIDCKLTSKGLSLIEMDEILTEVSYFIDISNDYPFEIIYFWQFLYLLIHLAWTFYGEMYFSYLTTQQTVLKTSFVTLMEEDVLINRGHHKGFALFDYLDLCPLEVAYNWYKSFGEPHTVKHFLTEMCAEKKVKKLNLKNVHFNDLPVGKNAYSHGIIYLPEDDCENDSILKNIPKQKTYFLIKNLGIEKVFHILTNVCPSLISGLEIININYQLSFLEFYETVVRCFQELLDEEERRIKAERERLLRLQRQKEKSIARSISRLKTKSSMKWKRG